MTKELLEKYLINSCSPKELKEIITWAEEEAKNPDSKKFSAIIKNSLTEKDLAGNGGKLNRLLDKIHHKINLKNSSIIIKQKTGTAFFTWMTRVAAVMLIPILSILIYREAKPTLDNKTFSSILTDTMEVTSPVGSRTSLKLADGTEVFLNHGSKLRYPQRFIGKNRQIELEGEAFFKVVHNPRKPFIVKTGILDIKAVGTTFNVMAYKNDPNIETTLVEGKVILEREGEDDKIASSIMARVSQHSRYNLESGKITKTYGNTEKYYSWKDGVLIFKNDHIGDIAKKISRWYNVDIWLEDENVKDYTYTATFVDETLTQILDLMVLATPIEYTIHPREKLSNGTYSKQIISINIKPDY